MKPIFAKIEMHQWVFETSYRAYYQWVKNKVDALLMLGRLGRYYIPLYLWNVTFCSLHILMEWHNSYLYIWVLYHFKGASQNQCMFLILYSWIIRNSIIGLDRSSGWTDFVPVQPYYRHFTFQSENISNFWCNILSSEQSPWYHTSSFSEEVELTDIC